MARVGRLAGAILAESDGDYFLIGNTKAPCDWAREGFENPGTIDALKTPWIALKATRAVAIGEPWLAIDLEGEALASALVQRFVIDRNGSVSDRLWRLVTNPDDLLEPPARSAIDARWLGAIPAPIWKVVRDSVLKCT